MKDRIDHDQIMLARTLFDAFAEGNLDRWQALLAPGFTFRYPGLADGKGAAAARAYNQPFGDAFSDWMTEVHRVAVEGDTVLLEMTIHARHTGPLVTPQGTFAATGRSGAVPCAMVAVIRDRRICYEATYWNVPDLMAQLFPAA